MAIYALAVRTGEPCCILVPNEKERKKITKLGLGRILCLARYRISGGLFMPGFQYFNIRYPTRYEKWTDI